MGSASEPRALRALSLDGGGVKGLSSLLILRRIMHNIKPSNSLYDIAKPCEYFDIICGTSTGGLIAIMLGRLRMGVQEAIDAYLDLAENVFQEPKYRSRMKYLRLADALRGSSRFSGDALAEAIQKIVRSQTHRNDAPLLDPVDNPCRVFVCATRTANTEPALLRSYSSSREEGCQAAIWEAARATSAAPTFFPPIKVGNPPAEYVDGAFGHNNPIRLLMREIDSVWGPDAELGCILSVGTGMSEPKEVGGKGMKVLNACKKLATSAEHIARNFLKDEGAKLEREGKYFRFNVTHGLQGIGLEEWQLFDKMDAATRRYLDDVNERIQGCCDRLKGQYVSMGSPRSPAAGPPSNVIVPRPTTTSPGTFDVQLTSSPYFVGRSNIIKAIEKHFSQRVETNSRIVVLGGLGGIGKTQTALHYFESHKSSYTSAFFVPCNSEQEAISAYVRFAGFVVDEALRATPTSSYDEIAKGLGFSGLLAQQTPLMEKAHRRVVKAVLEWLGQQQGRFLTILDNADDPKAMNLANYIPHHANGDVIITTRDEGARAFGELIKIEEMSEEEAVALLGKASHRDLDTKDLRDAAKKVTDALGYLPLAIDLASGYLLTSESDMGSFLSTYKLHSKTLLKAIPNDGNLGYKESALTTWEMSFGRLKAESPRCASFLHQLGFVHCRDICEQLFISTETAQASDSDLPEDGFVFSETCALLCKLSLMKRNEKPRTYEIHKVVHLWIRERLPREERAFYARKAIVTVSQALASHSQESSRISRQTRRRLYPHMEAAWEHVQQYTSPNDDGQYGDFVSALCVISSSFRDQGYFKLAEKGFSRVYKGHLATQGPDAIETLNAAAELAGIHKLRGDMDKAETLYRLAWRGFGKVLGPEDKATLGVLHALAGMVEYRGHSNEAIELYKQALEGYEKKYTPEDLGALEAKDSLAGLYQSLKRFPEAEPLQLFVLEARQKIQGGEHADTLKAVLKMGLLYSNMGEQDKALELFDRAYAGRVTLLKSQSSNAWDALAQIAALYANIGHGIKAERLYREVLSIQEDVLGTRHPATLWTLNHLYVILFSKERSEDAVKAVEKSAKDLEDLLGKGNLDTLWVNHNLAMIYAFQEKFELAVEVQERVVNGYLRELGPDHINTLYMVNDLGDCYLRAGDFVKAEEKIRTAFEGKRKQHGPRSQYTLYTAALLASVTKELGRRGEAEKLYKETFERTFEILGFDHSATWWIANRLAEFYVEADRWQEACDLYEKMYEMKVKFLGETHASTRHSYELLEETRKHIRNPTWAARSPILKRPAKSLPSDFGYRTMTDIVRVM